MNCVRPARFTALLFLALICSSCGRGEKTQSAEAWRLEAEASFAEGDAYNREADKLEADRTTPSEVQLERRADAVVAWRKAAWDYQRAFRLEDPVAERASARAMLAFRAGRALSKAARGSMGGRLQDARANEAFLWFTEALALAPDLRAVCFERAILHDSPIGSVSEPRRALEAYRSYLAAMPESGAVSESEKPRVRRARERIEALAGSAGG